MAHRTVLSTRQRSALFDLPTDKSRLPHHYTLADDDLDHIRSRRGAKNQMGFALQLCALRYPGRLLRPGEVIPEAVCDFLAAQLGLKAEDLLSYGAREETRYEHLATLRKIYGYKTCTGKRIKQMKSWLAERAEAAQSSEGLVREFVEECRSRQIILPGVSIIERLCADALVAAERRIDTRIAQCLEAGIRQQLDGLLTDTVDGRLSRFIWLRQFEVGRNTADQNRQLDRLEFLQEIDLSPTVLDGVPPHRIKALRRQGERYFTGGLQEITSDRRIAILATCVVEWSAAIADTIVETHDRITGKIWRDAKKTCELHVQQGQADIAAALAGFGSLGTTLLLARGDNAALIGAVEASCGWDDLGLLVSQASQLGQVIKAEPLDHIAKGFHSFKLYAKRMLKALTIKAAPEAEPLLDAAHIIRDGTKVPMQPLSFLSARSSWRSHLKSRDPNSERLWMVAVMYHLREAFRPHRKVCS